VKFSYPGMPAPDIIKFHRKLILIDLHVDSLIVNKIFRLSLCRQRSYLLPQASFFFHADVPRFRLGNVGAVFLGLVPFPWGRNWNNINSQIDRAEKTAKKMPKFCTMARSAEDVIQAKKENKTAFLLGLEGATCIDSDPRLVKHYAKRGCRYLGLVHFNENFAASPKMGLGSKGGNPDFGITKHGQIAIDECVKHGVIMDLAHISKRGFFELLDYLPKGIPAIVSHTIMKKVHDHPRGLEEDQVQAIKSRDGVMGIMNARNFLGGKTLKVYVKHVLAARDLAGYKHVAIGSDLDGGVVPVKGLEDVSRYAALTAALLDEGIPRNEIAAIYGENMLRVLKKVPPKYKL